MEYSKLICHRMPERSFFIRGHQFPVYARCTGFYLGGFLYFLYAYFYFVEYSFTLIALAVLFLMPAFIDGFTQLLEYRMSSNRLRFFTGLIGGIGLGILVKAFKYYLVMNMIMG